LEQADKKIFVRRMFEDIHARYDLLNTILSFGQDVRWRRWTIRDMPRAGITIDLCSGGGELASELLSNPEFTGEVILADIAAPMLRHFSNIMATEYSGRYYPVVCDVEELPFKENVFEGAISAFGLRNLTDLGRFSSEVYRTIRPGGIAQFLEIAHPRNAILGVIFKSYFYYITPLVARLFTGKVYAYRYLPGSLKSFPRQDKIMQTLSAGWEMSEYENLFGGIAAIYKLSKQRPG
jgi:demethylmenaquinone methyltransferase/2-methoxy-6-polyprenyl-1,4-benzoquinol methylase